MFKNCVFKASVSTTEWFKKAGIRAAKTMSQTAITLIGADVVTIYSLDWKFVLGCVATSGVLSLLTSINGIPEVEEKEEK